MEMAYRERWKAEIAEMRRVLGGFVMKEECKWGKPTYTVDGKNVVIMQGFKEYFALGFFQGALLKDPKKVLVQLGRVHAARVMKFTSAKEIRAKAATIKAYVREVRESLRPHEAAAILSKPCIVEFDRQNRRTPSAFRAGRDARFEPRTKYWAWPAQVRPPSPGSFTF